jgi:hypothetical protein
MLIRWATSKGLVAILLFTLLAILVEFLVVIYAISLGVTDPTLITVTWPATFTISPLFHLIPITVIITLVSTWTYLTKKLATRIDIRKPQPQTRTKTQQPKTKQEQTPKPAPSMWHRIRFTRATFKTTLLVTLVFLLFILMVSVLVYPQLIFHAVSGAYQNNTTLRNFTASINDAFQGFAQATGPLGSIAHTINNGILAASPGIKAAGNALGNLLAPAGTLDSAGKYLAIQNVATWISVLLLLLYAQYSRKGLRYRRK